MMTNDPRKDRDDYEDEQDFLHAFLRDEDTNSIDDYDEEYDDEFDDLDDYDYEDDFDDEDEELDEDDDL